jgi:TetR/AcrR family transcriptional repressor of nem operon
MADDLDTRARLIDVGMDLFYRHGYGAVGVQELCARAGVSKSSFYHFFPAKEDLALAVLDARWQGFERMVEPLQAGTLPPLDKIGAFFGSMHTLARQSRAEHGAVFGCPFGSLGSEMSSSTESVRARVAQIFDRMAALFRAWLDEAAARGDIAADLDTRTVAADLVAAMQALSVIGRVYNDPKRIKAQGERLLRSLLFPSTPSPDHRKETSR